MKGRDTIHHKCKVYLSTENLALPKGQARKLMPKYIGPYKVTKFYPTESWYILDLPTKLKAQRIHPSFCISQLCTYNKNDNAIFPKHEVCTYYDFGNAKDNKWLVDNIVTHQWNRNKVSLGELAPPLSG